MTIQSIAETLNKNIILFQFIFGLVVRLFSSVAVSKVKNKLSILSNGGQVVKCSTTATEKILRWNSFCFVVCGCASRGVGAHSCVRLCDSHIPQTQGEVMMNIFSPVLWHLFVYIPDMLHGDRVTDTISLPGLSVHHSVPLAHLDLSTSSQIDRGQCWSVEMVVVPKQYNVWSRPVLSL